MPRDDMIGTVIDGRFEVREKLGQGGMGAVYRAYQRSVKREVAIKLIKPALVDAKSAKRFEREAQLASRLSQPNTVSIFDYGRTDDGRLFIVMELIKGRTLLDVLYAEGALPVERTVRIGSQICDALEAAHALGIVHRDLKLDNVILLDEPKGRDLIKVLDFGLAKVLDEVSISSGSGIVGTPRYMAPEVAMKGVTSFASDIYALGVIVGELATAEPLWPSENFSTLIAHKLAPASAVELVPPLLRRPVGAMLDPEPTQRPTAAQARTLLRTVADGSVAFPTPRREEARSARSAPAARNAAPSPARKRPSVRWPFLAVALLAITGAAYLVAAGYIAFP